MSITLRNKKLWLRLGENAGYDWFEELDELVDILKAASVDSGLTRCVGTGCYRETHLPRGVI